MPSLDPRSPSPGRGAPDDRELAVLCARLAVDRQARDVRLLFVGESLGIAEYFVLATVNNRRQARAIRDAIRVGLRQAGAGVPARSSEDPDGRWSLYDYGSVVVHVFDDEGRGYFDLDRLWNDAPEVPFEDAAAGLPRARRPAR
jgi:ribosome-associated protein